jgi:hypothetical protein
VRLNKEPSQKRQGVPREGGLNCGAGSSRNSAKPAAAPNCGRGDKRILPDAKGKQGTGASPSPLIRQTANTQVAPPRGKTGVPAPTITLAAAVAVSGRLPASNSLPFSAKIQLDKCKSKYSLLTHNKVLEVPCPTCWLGLGIDAIGKERVLIPTSLDRLLPRDNLRTSTMIRTTPSPRIGRRERQVRPLR